jgi:hypothetical protein
MIAVKTIGISGTGMPIRQIRAPGFHSSIVTIGEVSPLTVIGIAVSG